MADTRKFKIYVPLILLCLSVVLHAGTGGIKFERLGIREGMSQSSVRSMLQDRRGFMWFGTVDGLNKYDGYDFEVKKPDAGNANSLSSPFIRPIIEDREGILWIGTRGGGLNRYDPVKDQFTWFRHDPENPGSLANDYVWALFEDSKGRIWTGTDGGGLNLLLPGTGTFRRWLHDPRDAAGISSNSVWSICEDHDGKLWLGTRGGGLERFDPETGTFTHFRHDPADPGSLCHDRINVLFRESSGTLWIGTDGGGLDKFDPRSGIFTHYRHDPANPNSLNRDAVLSILPDGPDTIWVGTLGGGVNKLNPQTGVFSHFVHDDSDPDSISDDHIYSIFKDRSGVLWFGTEIGGVNKLSANKQQFLHYRGKEDDPAGLSDNHVWSLYEEPSGVLWIGTRDGGITRLDREKEEARYFAHRPQDRHHLVGNRVRTIYHDPAGSGLFWIGTDGKGLQVFDPVAERFLHRYRLNPTDPEGISSDYIYSVLRDHKGNLWIGGTGGLNRLDEESGRFIHYRAAPGTPGSLSDDFVYVIREDRYGTLWIGTFAGGLNKMNRENGTFTPYRTSVDDASTISSNCVLCLYEDNKGAFWAGTGGGGLNKFDRRNNRFVRYRVEHGLPNGVIYGILEDPKGNLWLSTNNGLARFNPTTEMFKNYNETDGLQSNEFNGGAYFRSPRTGEMFFGGINGFNAFYPEKIRDNTHIPPVVLTLFRKFNKEVKLEVPIYEKKTLVLDYQDSLFSFEFSALDYTAPGKNRYMYKMENLHGDWISTASWRRYAGFTTLAPGEYVFRVKGSNNDGIWNEEGVSLKLVIMPPYWRTWWFQGGVVLVVLLLGWGLYRRRVNNLAYRMRMEMELRTARDAQMAIMPHGDPEVPGFDISGRCIPANEVGGDFFDYLWFDEQQSRFGIVVGDVSGKAMKAAMTAIMSDGIIISRAFDTHSIKELMTGINRPLYLKTQKQVFTTLCMASIDVEKKVMTFANAGLNAPLMNSGGQVRKLDSSGPRVPLGISKKTQYEEVSVHLKPGDILVFYTDGISEAWNLHRELYGSTRLVKLLEKPEVSRLSSRKIIDKILVDIKRFCGGMTQSDDITVVVVKVL